MRKAYFLFFLICITQVCCKQNSKQKIEKETQALQENSFFPVTQIIQGELAEIDSLPVTPVKITSINGKDDSVWLKKTDIRTFAEPFLHPEIDTISLKKFYTETSFLDQTINAFTFSYDLNHGPGDTAELKNWNVYVDPETNKIIRIYMVKKRIINNSENETIQLTWKFGKWCKMATITELPGKTAQVKEEKMIWDFNE